MSNNEIYKKPESNLVDGCNLAPSFEEEAKTFILLPVSKSSWILPLAVILIYSLMNFDGRAQAYVLGSFFVVEALFILGFTYGIKGIFYYRRHGGVAVLVHSIIGVLINLCLFALLSISLLSSYFQYLNVK